jgi:hypothetical protein
MGIGQPEGGMAPEDMTPPAEVMRVFKYIMTLNKAGCTDTLAFSLEFCRVTLVGLTLGICKFAKQWIAVSLS